MRMLVPILRASLGTDTRVTHMLAIHWQDPRLARSSLDCWAGTKSKVPHVQKLVHALLTWLIMLVRYRFGSLFSSRACSLQVLHAGLIRCPRKFSYYSRGTKNVSAFDSTVVSKKSV
ncbi:hypothetical protein BDV26DRAFT_222071 [Aspergillus bertholletiae]|uniref:Uncharacterized protein n=1 Tax=Aspergillus bertholletiae TaxID=1226010 RepID=A0A5N7B6H8_9EURO|nr:hypothetical protein BDV26DRAFT_222071 [Aspergillus bertholletiae]